MSARIRLYNEKHGDTVIYDGPTGVDFMDFLSVNGNRWGQVDIGNARLYGTFIYRYSPYGFGNSWWEFEQDNDYELLLQHMMVPVNPFVEQR